MYFFGQCQSKGGGAQWPVQDLVTRLGGPQWGGSRNTKNGDLLLEAECTRLHWPMEEANEGPSCLVYYSSRVTHHEFYYRSPMEYLQKRFEKGLRRWSGTWSIRTGWRE